MRRRRVDAARSADRRGRVERARAGRREPGTDFPPRRWSDCSREICGEQPRPAGSFQRIRIVSARRETGAPINRSVLVRVEAAVLTRCPPTFRAGVHCGLVRFPNAAKTDPSSDPFKRTKNAGELHSVLVFEQLVARGDSRQLLVYPATDPDPSFAAYDYGHAFGGNPVWAEDAVRSLQPAPTLPAADALGAAYADGQP